MTTTRPAPWFWRDAEMFSNLRLRSGYHRDPRNGLCLMEAVAWLAREPHTDTPLCVDPLLTGFGVLVNDMVSPDTRQERLKPLIPALIGTRGDGYVRKREQQAAIFLLCDFPRRLGLEVAPPVAGKPIRPTQRLLYLRALLKQLPTQEDVRVAELIRFTEHALTVLESGYPQPWNDLLRNAFILLRLRLPLREPLEIAVDLFESLATLHLENVTVPAPGEPVPTSPV